MDFTISDINYNDEANKKILEKHITSYLKSASKVLASAFFILFLSEIVLAIFVKIGYFAFTLKNKNGFNINYWYFVKERSFYQIGIWITFLAYYFLFKNAGFKKRQTLMCILTLLITTIYCFGHWRNEYLSILYIVPTIVAIPLDKIHNKIIFFSSIILILIYGLFQYLINNNEINFIIGVISIVTIIAVQLIGIKVHNTMTNSFLDIKEYATQQEILYEEISHDVLTGAFSKVAFQGDLHNISDYNSLAFIDVDNFKHINDNMGHQMGDNILKLLVFCLKTKDKRVYRYGGDEFVILSGLSPEELRLDLKNLKNRFSYYAEELCETKATISVGIIKINPYESGAENVKRCDELMYKSKEKGKNTLTVEGIE